MLKTNAYAAYREKESLKPFQIQRKELGLHDVAIDIAYCGVCHSDIHQVNGEWGEKIFPMVPGHEIAGTVVKVGPKVTKFKVGDKVGVGGFVDSCGTCDPCKEGLEPFCENHWSVTYNGTEQDGKTPTYGGYSTDIIVDENYVLRIPDNLPLDKAAPLLCAGITTYSPLRQWKIKKGDKVAVVGLGGLGHVAVKIAAAMGAEVSVLSHSPDKKNDALKFGAKQFICTQDKSIFKKYDNYFDFMICTVSQNIDLNLYLHLLKRDKTLVLVGIPDKPFPIDAFTLIERRRRLAGSLIGGIKETQEMLDFCSEHNITPEIEQITMDEINTAFEKVKKGDVKYRFVIDISSLKT